MAIELGNRFIYVKTSLALWYIAQHRMKVPQTMSREPTPAASAGNMEVIEVDATGLTCPMPLLKAKKALNDMRVQQQLRVLATDPGSVKDFEVFARQSGHLLLESAEANGRYSYLLEKKR